MEENCPTSLNSGKYQDGVSGFDTPSGFAKWGHLDREEFYEKYVRDTDEGGIVQFFIPGIACASCVSLLERLPKKNSAVNRAQVNFANKQLTVAFDRTKLPLSELAAWLEELGYTPEFQEKTNEDVMKSKRGLIVKLAVAGFAFVSIMLLALSEYFGGEDFALSEFKDYFGLISLFISIPVVFFSGAVYFSSAYNALRAKVLNIDVPVALGIATLFIRSTLDVMQNGGMGYFDSLAGLVFFLLIGKWYQTKTYDDLNYERDYKSWFPINVMKEDSEGLLVSTPISDLKTGDVIRIHHGEIVPADAILIAGEGLLDKSFTTGESHPEKVKEGAEIEAGGRQLGGAIILRVVRPVEQSQLTRLWNSETFSKKNDRSIKDPIDRISKHFTLAVLFVAFGTLFFWFIVDLSIAWEAFTATLIVACPCALALSLPFTYGSVLRLLGREGAYLKNTMVVERMARVKHLVFDKTGTLTPSKEFKLDFEGVSTDDLSKDLMSAVSTLANQSAHPMSRAIARFWTGSKSEVLNFQETVGAGVQGELDGFKVQIGSKKWIASDSNYSNNKERTDDGFQVSYVYVKVNDNHVGRFSFAKPIRAGVDKELRELSKHYTLHLLSGDSNSERSIFSKWFAEEYMKFEQTPEEKRTYIEELQSQSDSSKVAMVGDGLNDAAALQSSDLGVAVVDDLYAFSPSSDLILDARSLRSWGGMMRFARKAQTTVYILFGISFLYNAIGLSFAVQGLLTPVIAAILMPISSMTVVGVALLRTRLTWSKLLNTDQYDG